MRPVLTLVIACCVGVTTDAAPVPKAKPKTLEQKLIGTWKFVPQEDKDRGYTLCVEYKAGGVMEIRYEFYDCVQPGRRYTGTWKAIDPDAENELGTIDWTVNEDGTERGEVAKISKLTDDELTEVDPKGVVEHFERVKAKQDK